jgi:hypothetical protein
MMDKTSGLFISTVMGPDNPYTELLGRKHPKTGKPLFKKVEMTLVCKRPECLVNPMKCLHRIHRIPPWQSVAKHYVSQTMIGSSHVIAREMAGSVADDGIKAFEPGQLRLMFDSFIMSLQNIGSVKFCITSVDPNNDGSSDYALVSMLFSNTIGVVQFFYLQCLSSSSSFTFSSSPSAATLLHWNRARSGIREPPGPGRSRTPHRAGRPPTHTQLV